MNIQNLSSYDPFADLGDESKPDATTQAAKKQQTQNYVHIRIQQRNGRKTLTTLQGLPKGRSLIEIATFSRRKDVKGSYLLQ